MPSGEFWTFPELLNQGCIVKNSFFCLFTSDTFAPVFQIGNGRNQTSVFVLIDGEIKRCFFNSSEHGKIEIFDFSMFRQDFINLSYVPSLQYFKTTTDVVSREPKSVKCILRGNEFVLVK